MGCQSWTDDKRSRGAGRHHPDRMTIVGVSTAKVAPELADAPVAEQSARAREVMHEARTEAVIVLAIDVALFGGSRLHRQG